MNETDCNICAQPKPAHDYRVKHGRPMQPCTECLADRQKEGRRKKLELEQRRRKP